MCINKLKDDGEEDLNWKLAADKIRMKEEVIKGTPDDIWIVKSSNYLIVHNKELQSTLAHI